MLNVTIYRVEIELLSHLLGTCPKDPAVYSSYIASKAEKALSHRGLKGLKGAVLANGEAPSPEAVAVAVAEEVETVPVPTVEQLEEKGWTGFHTDDEGPFLYDYAVKGFLCSTAQNLGESPDGKVLQLMDKFKKYAYVRGVGEGIENRRRIRLPWPKDEPLPVLERPLRAMTAQGPRVTVVRSDYIPEGSRIRFDIHILKGNGSKKPEITRDLLHDVLSWGEYMGLGQWRSGSHGQFSLVSLEKA